MKTPANNTAEKRTRKNAPGAGRPTLPTGTDTRELTLEAAQIDTFLSANKWIAAAAIGALAGMNKTLLGRIRKGQQLTAARVDALAAQLEKLTHYQHHRVIFLAGFEPLKPEAK